jgi:D-lactate dehydrogenase
MAETAFSAEGADAVCVFVHDQLDRRCLETLAKQKVKLVVLRCAGHNNVDLAAARALKIAVTRAADYSPHAVAEHAVALLLTLNRKIHRAYNRVRDQNFALTGLVGFDLHGKTAGILGTGKIGQITAGSSKGSACGSSPSTCSRSPNGRAGTAWSTSTSRSWPAKATCCRCTSR